MGSDFQRFAGRWFVVKIGGELALGVPKLARTVGRAVKHFVDAGVRVAVVHGGGPQANALSKRLGLVTQQVAGQRVTDEETLTVMKQRLGGQVSLDVATAFHLAGVPVLATTGVSAGLVRARRRPPVTVAGEAAPVDYGLVGDIVEVNTARLEQLAAAGLVPVLGSLAVDDAGQVLNINADTMATRVAGALRAAKLLLVSNVPGVLAKREDPSSRIPRLSTADAKARIADGTITGGMIPKVEESLAMLDAGIDAIHIVGLEPDSALLDEAAEPGRFGTVFVR